MPRELSQDFLNRVEVHYERLLPPGMNRRARESAKSVLRHLYDEGASAKLASRFLCTLDSDDPGKCVVPLPDDPRPSRGQAARKPAASVELPAPGQVRLARPRKGRATPRRGAAKPNQPAPEKAKTAREQADLKAARQAHDTPTARAQPNPAGAAQAARPREPLERGSRAAVTAPVSYAPRLRPILVALGWPRTGDGPDRTQVVTWEPERETNAFLLALGGSGSGKSELLKALALRAGTSVPVVVLDFHGDLTGLQLPNYLAGRAGVSINPLALVSTDPQYGGPVPQTEAVIDAVRRAAPGFGRLQEVGLRDAILATYKAAHITDDPASWSRAVPRLGDIREHIRAALHDPARKLDYRSLSGVLAAIDAAFSDAAFRGEGELPLTELLRAGGRLDLSRLSRSAQILAADSLLRQIFGRLRSQGVATQPGRYRVLVIADEASILKGAAILDELFKEARKFGLALVLASQESSDFSSAVRANAATLIALRTNSAKEAAEYSRELSRVSAAQILQLTGPGDGFLRNQAGTRRIQVAPTTVALTLPAESAEPAAAAAAAALPAPPKTSPATPGAIETRFPAKTATCAAIRAPSPAASTAPVLQPAPVAAGSASTSAARSVAPARASSICPGSDPSCKLGLLGGACGLPAALVLAAPAGAPVPQTARYCLASARKLIASHDPRTFTPRADYPAEVQERRYEADQGEQLKVLRIAENLNPALIFNTIPSVTDGTPVVTEAGVVLGGNGRTLGLQRHYLDGGTLAKIFLAEHAREFGFSAEDIEALQDPVVVRVVDPGTSGLSDGAAKRRLQHLVRVLNVPLIKELDQQASAVALARQLDEGVFNTLATALDDDKTLAEYLHSARSRELVVELQRVGVFRETNLAAYVGSAGFTETGRRLLEKTLAASLVEDASVLEALGEGTQATLARGAPWLVAATAYGADWDVRPRFLAAARDVVAIRRAQIHTVSEYLRQNALFAAEAPPSSRLPGGTVVLQVLAELSGAPLRFARFARSYYEDARRNLSSQGALFAAEKVLPGEALLRAAKAAGIDLPQESADQVGIVKGASP